MSARGRFTQSWRPWLLPPSRCMRTPASRSARRRIPRSSTARHRCRSRRPIAGGLAVLDHPSSMVATVAEPAMRWSAAAPRRARHRWGPSRRGAGTGRSCRAWRWGNESVQRIPPSSRVSIASTIAADGPTGCESLSFHTASTIAEAESYFRSERPGGSRSMTELRRCEFSVRASRSSPRLRRTSEPGDLLRDPRARPRPSHPIPGSDL